MKKLPVTRGRLLCPKFHPYRENMKQVCPKCKFFKGVEGEFGTGVFVLCGWEKEAEHA